MLLIGKNLGERQKDLNTKVNDAVARKLDFKEIKKQTESSDIDKLFKIDVASKYKDTNYILEVLKSKDDLHISRALRSKWLYDDEFSHIINPDYLQKNVFPHMSSKMQRKMLTAISLHIQDQIQAEGFFKYSLTFQVSQIELKFLPLMSEQSRLNFIISVVDNWKDIEKKIENVIGDSFILAEACIQKVCKFNRDKILYRLRYLYSVSQQKYLDLFEKYAEMDTNLKFGLRISKDISIKHKDRILAHPLPYLQKLNNGVLSKHSTKEEVKLFAKTWLPNEVTKFWKGKYCKTHKQLLKSIPIEERFLFIQGLFREKYPGEEFETSVNFYTSGSYIIMTKKQKQLWALQNLEQENTVCNDNSYFKWYQFLPFEMTLADFKKESDENCFEECYYETLIKACKSQSDLEKLFEYYLENFKSEDAKGKTNFVFKILQNHEVYRFKDRCWELYQELLLDNDVVNHSSERFFMNSTKVTVFLYHILNNKEIPNELKCYTETKHSFFIQSNHHLTNAEYQKFENFLIMHQKKLEDNDNSVISEETLYRQLKKNVDLLKPIDYIKNDFITIDGTSRMTKFLRKLKIYFPYDTLTKEYLEFFYNSLRTPDPDTSFCTTIINFSVAGLFLLSSEADMKKFILAHIPSSGAKYDWRKFDPSVLIQQAICTYAYLSRPLPDPTTITKYVTGDYVRHCSPLLGAFAVSLPFDSGIIFLETLFKSPNVKVQKRALKLAFRYYPEEAMYPLFLKVWKTTNNKKFRKILYEAMSSNLMILNDEHQIKMYKDFFGPMTLGLRKDELSKRIGILKADIPETIRGLHLKTMWELSTKLGTIRSSLLKEIALNISFMEKEFMDKIVNDYCIHDFWTENKLIVGSRMALIAAYLLFFTEKEELKKTVETANLTMTKLIHLHVNGTSTEKVMIWNFLSELAIQNFIFTSERKRRQYHVSNEILTEVLNQLLRSVPFENVSYVCFWQIKLSIIWNHSMDFSNEKLENKDLDRKTVTQEVMQYYADQVHSTIEDLEATGHYNQIEISNVAKEISDNLEVMSLLLRNGQGLIWLNFYIFFVERLVSFGKEENHILGLHVLPAACAVPACALDYGKLLETIGSFENSRVQALLQKKFYVNSRKRRLSSDEE